MPDGRTERRVASRWAWWTRCADRARPRRPKFLPGWEPGARASRRGRVGTGGSARRPGRDQHGRNVVPPATLLAAAPSSRWGVTVDRRGVVVVVRVALGSEINDAVPG